jgi:hypothetical protein
MCPGVRWTEIWRRKKEKAAEKMQARMRKMIGVRVQIIVLLHQFTLNPTNLTLNAL